MFSRQPVDRSRPAIDFHIAVFIHILSLNNLLGAVAAQKGKQLVQTVGVVRSDGSYKGAARQSMDNIRFQRPLCHIDYTGMGAADKVYRASGADSLILPSGGQRQILRPLLIRRVVFVPDRMVQPDLQSMEQTVHAAQRDQDARCARVEFDGPLSIVVYIEAGNTLYAAALIDQALRQCPAKSGGWGALEPKAVNIVVRQSPYRPQMFPVRRRQRQQRQQRGQRPVDLLVRGLVRGYIPGGWLFDRADRGRTLRRKTVDCQSITNFPVSL